MSRNFSLGTLAFLECLAAAVGDTVSTLAHPTLGRLTAGAYDDEPLERKLRRLAARGVITLPEPADPRILHLTELGHSIASGGISPKARWARPWDGRWRMVLFDVAEQERPLRTRLRYVLRQARLGYLQGSVWISPDPLGELRDTIRSLTANPEALLFFEGLPSAGESNEALVKGAWDFRRLAAAHRECLEFLHHAPADSAPPQRWRTWLVEERENWFRALKLDPLLPEKLLPRDYLGKEVSALRRIHLRRAFAHCGGRLESSQPDK
jgi:phenylacetic acid degradation operon negative regulatory protein